ncbi:MAG: NfeD family protein [Phycisphaeraceae bacterium]|nr:MAG: NfeD family protein [Phycisphaeraceae bacterium]
MLDQLFSGNALLFSVPAVAGTLFFAFRLVLMFAGIGGDELDADGADGIDPGHAHDSTQVFKFLSVQSIAAFVMGFGWGGVGALLGAGWEMTSSILVAVAGGVGMVWLLTWLLKLVYDLQSSGNVNLQDAVGVEGEVYASIPGNREGTGQVKVVLSDRQRIYNAFSEGEPLPSRTRVRIVKVNEDHTLTVMRV